MNALDPQRLVTAAHDAALDFYAIGGLLFRNTCYNTSAALRRVLLRAGEQADVTFVHATATTATGAAPYLVEGLWANHGRIVTTPHVAVLWTRAAGDVWLLDPTIDQAEVVEGQRPAPVAVPVTLGWICGAESRLVESNGLFVQYTISGIPPRNFQPSLVRAIERRLLSPARPRKIIQSP